ncbi:MULTISPECIES: cation:proton antiporter [Euryhalocaulis]|uniref:cation:proton antiporter domain-containing protein n=1 Tax=Euryhalocaulis TaxID=1712422 RepID=UPI00039A620E|nr:MULTISPECIES: cation:proton antiporter [Euryhalocaulis]MBA4801045.1 cation:proton antiporter [Euryhalocaulis sp.]
MHGADFLLPALIFLAAGVGAILIARPLRISPIVGFLAAGVLLGPGALGVLEDNETTAFLAELGVVFLLFDIGLHFSARDLVERKADMLGLAPAQMALCGAAFIALARFAGLDWPIAIAVGGALALSSTAVVARVLAERNLQTCPLGRSGTAVLIFQDIVAIFLLVFVASLAGDGEHSVAADAGMAALKGAAAFVVALTLGRLVITPVFKALARTRNDEVFTAFALLLVVAAAWSTGALHLSLTLGAFLAGMIVADTPYRHVIQTEAKPFRNLLLGLFFINAGMAVELNVLFGYLPWIIGGALFVLALKTALIIGAALANRWTAPGATQLGFLLSQSSEFALVIIAMPAVAGALEGDMAGVLIAVVALTLAVTPVWSQTGMKLARKIVEARRKPGEEAPASASPDARPVVVFGMNQTGRLAVDALTFAKRDHLAMEIDPDAFISAIADGYHVTFGDAADMRLMETIGMTNACALVISRPRFELSEELTPFLKQQYPDLERFVAVETRHDQERHAALGIHAVIVKGKPKGVELVVDMLRAIQVDNETIAAWLADVREKQSGGDADAPAGRAEAEAA